MRLRRRERDTKKKIRENRKEDDAGTKEKKSRFRFPGKGYHRLRSTTPSTHAIYLYSLSSGDICLEEDDLLFFNVVTKFFAHVKKRRSLLLSAGGVESRILCSLTGIETKKRRLLFLSLSLSTRENAPRRERKGRYEG